MDAPNWTVTGPAAAYLRDILAEEPSCRLRILMSAG